jgi:hypothetical protein
MSYDIYVPLTGPAIMVPHPSSTLGVAFGPQAPPSPSQAPPLPPAPPGSALYGPLPSQVTASLTPPHGQGPPTGQVPVTTYTTTGAASAATQPMSGPGTQGVVSQLPPFLQAVISSRPVESGGYLTPGAAPAGGPQIRSPVQITPPWDRPFYGAGTGDHVMPGRSGPTPHRGPIVPL